MSDTLWAMIVAAAISTLGWLGQWFFNRRKRSIDIDSDEQDLAEKLRKMNNALADDNFKLREENWALITQKEQLRKEMDIKIEAAKQEVKQELCLEIEEFRRKWQEAENRALAYEDWARRVVTEAIKQGVKDLPSFIPPRKVE